MIFFLMAIEEINFLLLLLFFLQWFFFFYSDH